MKSFDNHKIVPVICAAALIILQLQSLASAGQKNLALHIKLDYDPKPAYPQTASPRDPLKLTDGVIGKCLWYEGNREKTVGWGYVESFEIVADLGAEYNVEHVDLYSSRGNCGGMQYPEYIMSLSSLDGRNYTPAGIEVTDDWGFVWVCDKRGLVENRKLTVPVRQRARYIKLIVRPTGFSTFFDEIEIIESEQPYSTRPSSSYANTRNQAIEIAERLGQVQRDLRAMLGRAESLPSGKEDFKQRFADLQTRISEALANLSRERVEKLESETGRLRAEFIRSVYGTDWLTYTSDPLDNLCYADIPPQSVGQSNLSFYQWQNEYSMQTFNLTNATQGDLTFQLSVSPLAQNGLSIPSESLVKVRRARYVFARGTGYFVDPLVLQGAKSFCVRPGETVQISVELNSKGIAAGRYTGAIAAQCEGQTDKRMATVPVNIEIADRVYRSNPSFMTLNWDNLTHVDNYTKNIVELAAQDLAEHYVNVSVISPGDIYRGTQLNPSLADRLNERSFARVKLLSLGLEAFSWRFGSDGVRRSDTDIYSDAWRMKFQSFMRGMIVYLARHGYGYDSYAIYPYDEYIGGKFIYVARLIRETDPNIRIYANHVGDGIKDVRKVFGLVDIWCPPLREQVVSQQMLDEIKRNCKEVWCYDTFSRNRLIKPIKESDKRFYRAMPIRAVAAGLSGAGFWVYSIDSSKGSFNDSDTLSWNVVYDGSRDPDKYCIYEPIVPSKRWQQWRLGVQDAVCLIQHKELLEEFSKKPASELTSEYLTSLRRRVDVTDNYPNGSR
jgi:hypothetical protein